MITETIYIHEEDKDLKFDAILIKKGLNGEIPSNCIIDKVRPNFGATRAEIEAFRNSIIIEPFITVMDVKKIDFKNKLCIINRNTSNADILSYLLDSSVEYKKLMVTPESFKRMIKVLQKVDKEYRNNYFLLYDECEKLVQQPIFRPDLLIPLDELFLFKDKALITATLLIPSDPRFSDHGFRILKFEPTFEYRKDLKLITTNNLRTSLRNQLSLYDDDKPVFIYTNCKESILYGANIDEVNTDYKIFCADDLNEKFFKYQNVKNVEYTVKDQQYAKFNFFTSRFFSAVDMYYPDGILPHVIILTNLPWVKHSIIDPSTEAVQICGRLRKGISSITHITKLFIDREVQTTADIEATFELDIAIIKRIKDSKLDFKNEIVEEVIGAIVDKSFAKIAFQNNNEFNTYFKDAYLHKKLVENKYVSPEALLKAYEESNSFKVHHINVKQPLSDEDFVKISRAEGKMKREAVADKLVALTNHYIINDLPEDRYLLESLRELRKEDELTYELFFDCGIELLLTTEFVLKRMKRLYFESTIAKRKNDYANMFDEILLGFPLNTKQYSKDIKNTLQLIYDKYAYTKGYQQVHSAKASDILNYFEGKCKEPKRPDKKRNYETYYILTVKKHSVSDDLKIIE